LGHTQGARWPCKAQADAVSRPRRMLYQRLTCSMAPRTSSHPRRTRSARPPAFMAAISSRARWENSTCTLKQQDVKAAVINPKSSRLDQAWKSETVKIRNDQGIEKLLPCFAGGRRPLWACEARPTPALAPRLPADLHARRKADWGVIRGDVGFDVEDWGAVDQIDSRESQSPALHGVEAHQ